MRDAVASTALGIKNLPRVADMLLPATLIQAALRRPAEIYGRMLGQWATELNHVSAIVGA